MRGKVKIKGTGKHVYIIEDDKYGVQAVFKNKEDAEYACENDGCYHVSGYGAKVFEIELMELA